MAMLLFRSSTDSERIPSGLLFNFSSPTNRATLVYRTDFPKVQIRPFGFSMFLKLTKKPTAKLVLNRSGHKFDESELVTLLENARRLAKQDSIEVLREEIKHEIPMLVVNITGKPEALADGVHSYLLWVDKSINLTRVADSYDEQDQQIEDLLIDDLHINPVFGEVFDLLSVTDIILLHVLAESRLFNNMVKVVLAFGPVGQLCSKPEMILAGHIESHISGIGSPTLASGLVTLRATDPESINSPVVSSINAIMK